MPDRLTLRSLLVLPGERVILRERWESDIDDRLRYPIDPVKKITTARHGGGTGMAAATTPAITWPPAMGLPSPATTGGRSSTKAIASAAPGCASTPISTAPPTPPAWSCPDCVISVAGPSAPTSSPSR
jgi:hypothetical protein